MRARQAAAVLGVPLTASADDIRNAFVGLARVGRT